MFLHRRFLLSFTIISIISAALCFTADLMAFTRDEYTSVMRTAEKLPSDELMKRAIESQKNYDHENALLLFGIVSGRYRHDMDDEEKELSINAFLRSGSIYHYNTKFVEALDMYLRALEICDGTESKPHIMELYTRIGSIYCNLEDYDTGISFLRKGYALRKKYPETSIEKTLLFDLTAYTAVIGDTVQAWKYYALAEQKREPADSVLLFRSFYNRGLIFEAEKRYRKAIDAFQQAIARTDNSRLVCHSHERLYMAWRSLDRPDSTLRYLMLTNREALALGLDHLYMSSLKDLAEFYAVSDPGKSRAYKDRYLEMLDSCYNRQEFDRLKTKQFTHAIDAERRHISLLESVQAEREHSMRQQRLLLIVIGFGLLTALSLLAVVVKKKRDLNASYQDLYLSSRRSLDTEKANEQKFREYEERIASLQNAIEQRETPHKKYSQSSLKDSHKSRLAEDIDNLMRKSDRMLQSDFTLAAMAAHLNSNSQYVSQVLNEVYGKSFTEFLNEYRVKEACRRILDIRTYGNYSMEGIGESVGYGSKSTFFRAFHKITGLSPSVYKKMAAKDSQSPSKFSESSDETSQFIN